MARNIHVAKITASATADTWSQAYHAGNLTAIVCVRPKGEEDPTSLHIVGKDLLNTFESEYFTLENKNLISIKQAVETTYKKSADSHTISFIVAAAIQNTLYVVLAGEGSILLIRKGKIGTLLEQTSDEPTILSSSGFLEHEDIVVLASNAFLKLIDKEKLFTTLSENTITDAAETLTPTVHATAQGDTTALFMKYEDETPQEHPVAYQEEQASLEKKPTEESNIMQPSMEESPAVDENKNEEPKEEEPIFSQPLTYSEKHAQKTMRHKRKVLLTIVIVLLLVLAGTVFFALRKQQDAKNAALFSSIYPQAEKKYEEGLGLMDLNPSLAQQDFSSAQQQLESIKSQLAANSPQQKQVTDLLAKIQQSLSSVSTENSVPVTKVDSNTNYLLSYAQANPSAGYITQDDTYLYSIDPTGVVQITKKSQATKLLVPKAWKTVGGFDTYLGNFYVLDTTEGILKFVQSGKTYAKSSYFATGVSPDLTQATSIAIDSSIWVLEKDGTIMKFTRGHQDSLTLSGFDKPLSSPTKIVTSADDTNVYILDNGNGRIVSMDKTGKFIKSYPSSLIKKATQLVVDEKAKTALFLNSGTIYQISL